MSQLQRRWRTALTVILAIYGYVCLRNPGEYRWLDSLDHDWAILLANWDWLRRDQSLADAVHLLGVVLYLAAIIGGWILLRREPQAAGLRADPLTR